eukprot:gene28808-37814_t
MSFLHIMKLYPLALMVTWLPRNVLTVLFSATVLSAGTSSMVLAGTCFAILSIQYGTLASIIYFSHSSTSRMLWVNLLKRNRFCFQRDRDASRVSFSDETVASDDNIEDALVIRAMIGRESMTFRESLTPARISERESSTTTNVMIQLTIPTIQHDDFDITNK